jgi:hypothetical protein
MKRTLLRGIAVVFAIAGCSDPAVGPQETTDISRVEAASAPATVPFEIVFDDVNPCSGLIHTVTIAGTERVHEHNGRIVVHGDRIITTSSGFVGRGTHTIVANGNIEKITGNDMLTHPSGARIRAHVVVVFDVRTSTVKVEKFAVTCVRQ